MVTAMKRFHVCILVLVTCFASLARADDEGKAAAAKAYGEFLSQLTKPENLIEFVEKTDRMIDEAEPSDKDKGNVGQTSSAADTRIGLHLEFAVIRTPEAILYYASLSRKNEEPLRYADAATLLAFVCDRAGLTHPVDIKEGEKPIFHAQWLLKPTEWKAMRKKMLEVRAYNRSQKDIGKAMRTAVNDEVSARMATKR